MSERQSTSECELNSGSYNAKIEDSRDGSNFNPSQGQPHIICGCMKEDLNVKYENVSEPYGPSSVSGGNPVYHHHHHPHHHYPISAYPKVDELPIGSYYSPYGGYHGTYADYPDYLSRKHAGVEEHKKDASHYPIPSYHKYDPADPYAARGPWLQHPPGFPPLYDEHYILANKPDIYNFPPVMEKKKRGRKPDENRGLNGPKQRGRRKAVTDETGGEGQSNRTPKRSLEFNSYIMRMDPEDLDKLKEIVTQYANKSASPITPKTDDDKKDVFKTEYSLLEDLNLVFSIASSGKSLGKKLFLDIMNSKVCGERTDSSMRLRYKFNLGALTKENLQEIFEYVSKNGPQGFLSFKTSTDGMKYFQRVEKEFKGPARPEFKGHSSKNGVKQVESAKRARAKRSLAHELDVEGPLKGEDRKVESQEPKEGKKGRKKRQLTKIEAVQQGLKIDSSKEYVPINIPFERAPKFKLEIRREGSFDAGDKIDRVESVIGELDDDLEFLVIWQEKLPGIRPKESKLPGKLIRLHDPRALLDYYTKNIIITKPLD